MSFDDANQDRTRLSPNAIPLQDLGASGSPRRYDGSPSRRRSLSDRGKALLRGGPRADRYTPIRENTNALGLQIPGQHDEEPIFSPVDPSFHTATGFAGATTSPGSAPFTYNRHIPGLRSHWDHDDDDESAKPLPPEELDDGTGAFPTYHDDMTPLTDAGRRTAALSASPRSTPSTRNSRARRSPNPNALSPSLGPSHFVDVERGHSRSRSSGARVPSGISLHPDTTADPQATKGSSIARSLSKVSRRVANITHEPRVVPSTIRRANSYDNDDSPRSPLPPRRSADIPIIVVPDTDGTTTAKAPIVEKVIENDEPAPPHDPNPLRGKSLGIFPPNNPLRKKLLDLLIHRWTEPFILLLIVIQTVLLAIDAGSSVYIHERSQAWGQAWTDYALLALFCMYTVELIIRVIVSGFIINPVQYSSVGRGELGFGKAVMNKANDLFTLHRRQSVHRENPNSPSQDPSGMRYLTPQLGPQYHPESEYAQRFRLAHRAFFRHSFNRLDFVAVVSYWISFALAFTGWEYGRHIYAFRMLACLRIVKLLGITAGTSVILRSLKRAMPILLNVAFLIGFFWLLFAIIGIQSFKSSLRRYCIWGQADGTGLQSQYAQNQTGSFQFCGGWLAENGSAMPYLLPDGSFGASTAKGYTCPVNSTCLEIKNPYNGTVSFDNLAQSVQLVFVIMTTNTFSDIMYYLTMSDYLPAAIFFAAGIVILTFWLVNLLIAVITSSFQIIREESKVSAFAAEDEQGSIVLVEKEELPPKHMPFPKAFERTRYLWLAIIAYSLIVQCLRTANMSHRKTTFLEISELVVTLLLDVEILLRFVVDWRGFIKQKRNFVDLGLAIATSVIQIPVIRHSGQPYAWLTVFQIARIYRLVLAVRVTRELILLVLGNFYGLANLILFVFLLTFLAAIFASQLFRGEIPEYDEFGNEIEVTFFNIWNAFLGMYQMLSSENWTTIMYSVTAFEVAWNTAWIGATFCILWYILANFIVLNMFIAVIQANFDVSEDEKRIQQVKAHLQQQIYVRSGAAPLSLSSLFKFGRVRRADPLDYKQATVGMLLGGAVVRDFLDDPDESLAAKNSRFDEPPSAAAHVVDKTTFFSSTPGIKRVRAWGRKLKNTLWDSEPNPFYSRLQLSADADVMDPVSLAQEIHEAQEGRKLAQREYLRKHPTYNVSLFVFKYNNPIRKMCQRIVNSGRGIEIERVDPYSSIHFPFSAFIYLAIVAMVLLACVTTPLFQKEYFAEHGYSRQNWFVFCDIGFAALFTLEAIIKVIADGFFWTPNAYFRDSWGFIDGVVLLTLWADVITVLYDPGGGSRAVGAFKALRALRLLNVSDSTRDTFHSVIVLGGWKVLSAAFVNISLLVPFAIYGLNLFSGRMQQCNDNYNYLPYGTDNNIVNLSDCVGEYMGSPFAWNVLAPRRVANSYYSFDDFGKSIFVLFQIVTQEGWIDVMWSSQSITGLFKQPQSFSQQGNAVYFVIFNLLGAVFVLTLFVSVFMRNYTEQTGVAFLTTEQRSWLELRKMLRQVSPSRRPSPNAERQNWQEWCYKRAIRKNGYWQRGITGLLVFHLILLCLEWYPDPTIWLRVRDYIFLLLTLFYIANIVIRIIGLSWARFIHSAWDVYSLLAITGTFVTTVLLLSNFGSNDYVQAHKLFLVSIALLLIPRNNQLDQLFKTAAASLTAIANLLATWFVLFLVFAIAMTQTFGLTRFNSTNENSNVNFRTVPKALVLLFRISVGEGWNQLMYDFQSVVPPYCSVGEHYFDGDCGSDAWAKVLFVGWNILSMYIFVNLFVSLIYESFSYVYQRSSGVSEISREEIRRFKQAWAEYDPSGSGYISKEAFPRLLGELSGVFEMRIYDGDFSVRELVRECRADAPMNHSTFELGSAVVTTDIDIDKLNKRLATLPVDEIKRRRQRMNTFYEEVLVSRDPERGIEFSALLMILAHYKVIDDNKSLRLEEFLRRRARLQRVHDAVQRNTVAGFFDTMYWTRQFRKKIEAKRGSRAMQSAAIDVPEIKVHDESNDPLDLGGPDVAPYSPLTPTEQRYGSMGDALTVSAASTPSPARSAPLSRGFGALIEGANASPLSPVSPDAQSSGRSPRVRSDSIQRSPSASPTRRRTSSRTMGQQSSPASAAGESQAYATGQAASSPVLSRSRGLSELHPAWGTLDPAVHSRTSMEQRDSSMDLDRTSRSRSASNNLSVNEFIDSLGDSAWGQSIRRVSTVRRTESNAGRQRGTSNAGLSPGDATSNNATSPRQDIHRRQS